MFLRLKSCLFIQFWLGMLFSIGFPMAGNALWQVPPEQFPTSPSGVYFNALAADANGHAIVVYGDESGNSNNDAWYYSNGTWSPTVLIPAGMAVSTVAVAMDPTGTALALLKNVSNGDLNTFFFNGTTWSTPPTDPLDISADIFPSMAVAMNGPGQGVAVWIDSTSVKSSFFSGGNWGAVTTIGTGDSGVSVAYSTNGTAVAGWQNASAATVANFIGGSWQTPVVLDPTGSFLAINTGPANYKNVGIDSSGKALAIWIKATGDVVASTFIGSTWQPPQTLSPGPGNMGSSLAMAPGGTAVAVWVDSSDNGISSAFNGTTWLPAVQFSTVPVNSNSYPSVAVDTNGNALVVWANTIPQVVSSKLPLGGVFQPQEIVDANPPSSDIFDVISALSSDGIGFANWLVDQPSTESAFVFANVDLLPLPPTSVQGQYCKNRFVTYTEISVIITWTPSTDPSVVAYDLRRNGVLISTIPASGPFRYIDRNLCSNQIYTYSLTSVDASGVESMPVNVILP